MVVPVLGHRRPLSLRSRVVDDAQSVHAKEQVQVFKVSADGLARRVPLDRELVVVHLGLDE
jgi:hypothetical protein